MIGPCLNLNCCDEPNEERKPCDDLTTSGDSNETSVMMEDRGGCRRGQEFDFETCEVAEGVGEAERRRQEEVEGVAHEDEEREGGLSVLVLVAVVWLRWQTKR